MNFEFIELEFKALDVAYTELQNLQRILPDRYNRRVNHEEKEQEIRDSAFELSRRIVKFKNDYHRYCSENESIASIFKGGGVDSILHGVTEISHNPYKKF